MWLHIVTDGLIFLGYLAIPVGLLRSRGFRRLGPQFALFYWFAAFIFLCGLTHLWGILAFLWPTYRLDGLVKLLCAVATWGTLVSWFVLARRLRGISTGPPRSDSRSEGPFEIPRSHEPPEEDPRMHQIHTLTQAISKLEASLDTLRSSEKP